MDILILNSFDYIKIIFKEGLIVFKVNKLFYYSILTFQFLIAAHYSIIFSDRLFHNYLKGYLFFIGFIIILASFSYIGLFIIRKLIVLK